MGKLQCFDESIALYGSRDQQDESYIRIIFESCDAAWFRPEKSQQCKSRSEINEWIKNKAILTLYNEESFN